MKKLCHITFYSHQNLKPSQEESRLSLKAPRSKRVPKTVYKSFVLYVVSANMNWLRFLRLAQIDAVIWSVRDQPINQKRKQCFSKPLKFSLCWIFFFYLSKELTFCISAYCTLHGPLPLDTRLPSFIPAVDATLLQKKYKIKKKSCKQENKYFVMKKISLFIWQLKNFIPEDGTCYAMMSSDYGKFSGCKTHLLHIAKELGEIYMFHLQNSINAIIRQDGRSFRIHPVIFLQSLRVPL